MSVINKMLRDLDHRQATFGGAAAKPVGISSVSLASFAQRPTASKRLGWFVLGLLLLGLAMACAWWVWAHPMPLQATVVQTSTPPMPSVAIQAQPSASAPVQEIAKNVSTSRAAPQTPLRLESSAPLSLKTDMAPPRNKQAHPSIPQERLAPAPSDSPNTPASTEVLEQAQALWSAGSRDAAQELLQEAVVAAERTGGTSVKSNTSLLALVRELTRMQLAEARYGAVWDLLTRLEPQLGSQPDLWAIRANAAQRLGHHQDSVHAYLVALQARPHEQRWLLGTAVSLAALGQTASAGEMADKARAVGSVNPEILVYLRQMGVPLANK